jgi:hypothetical protein
VSYNYLGVKSTASSLLSKFGQQLTFTRTANSTYDPDTGTATTSSSTYTKYACAFDYTDRERAEGTIQAGDRRLLAEGHTYEIGDSVSLNGDTYRIVNISNIQPGDTAVACNLQIRK